MNQAGYWFWIDVEGERRKTVLVSRELLAQKLGRPLAENEQAHHIDGNPNNNDPSNLEVRDRSEHIREHATRAWAGVSAEERRLKLRRFIEAGNAASVKAFARRRKNKLRQRVTRERARLASGAVSER